MGVTVSTDGDVKSRMINFNASNKMSAFTKPKKKNFRKRKQSSDSDLDSDENEDTRPKIEDIKDLQKTRERQKGVDIVGLALGKKIPKTEDVDHDKGSVALNDKYASRYLRQRSSNWTERDKMLAIQLVLDREEELYNTTKGKYTNKVDSWINVVEEFNVNADESRTPEQLKKCFENMRGAARKYVEDLKVAKTTGGMMPREPKPSIKLIIDKIKLHPNDLDILQLKGAETNETGMTHVFYSTSDSELNSTCKVKIERVIDDDDDNTNFSNGLNESEESNNTTITESREHIISSLRLKLQDNQNACNTTQSQSSQSLPHDPFKMRTGGYVDMKALKTQGTMLTEEEKDAIGTAFAAETNRRDEDAEMAKFVEDELKRRKGVVTEERRKSGGASAEDSLYELPEHLKSVTSKFKKSEDMLSNQMLSGIPEIDLGIEAKIKNIEETEEAKQKLIQERMKKKETVSEFVPTNMAVNFVQHNRFNIEDTAPILKKDDPVPVKQARVEDPEIQKKNSKPLTVQPDEKATDNYHFDRFKKQMRR